MTTITNQIQFSLIVATYGRLHEVENLLLSLDSQTLPSELFEIIIVDQNDNINLSPIINKYKKKLNIEHIHSKKKGLSYNRNIGLKNSSGKYVCFPDDDCTYYPDTLSTVLKCFDEKSANTLFGAIRDRATGENIIRKWPKADKEVTRLNFFNLYSSITVFTKLKDFKFNEDLGVGCYFGSCEDSDYCYRLIKEQGNSYYCSNIEVWHPKQSITHFTKEKNISYGLGFGAFCAVHRYDPYITRLLLMAVGFHFFHAIINILKLDSLGYKARIHAALYRIKGFIEYNRK